MKKTSNLFLILLITILLLSLSISTVSAQDQPVARVILFFSTSCGHCEYVITETLPPLFEEYGDQLVVLLVEVYDPTHAAVYIASDMYIQPYPIDLSIQSGADVFMETIEEIGYPMDQVGVPFMLVDDKVMVGSGQIPEELPGVVTEGLAGDGIPWPQVSALQNFLLAQGFLTEEGQDITPTPMPTVPATEAPEQTLESAEAIVADKPEPTVVEEEEPAPTEEPSPTAEPEASEPVLITEGLPTGSIWDTLVFRFNHDRTANTIAVITLLILISVVVYIAVNFMRAAVLKPWPEWILPVLLVIGIGIASYLASVEISGAEAVCGPVGDCNTVQQSKYATLFGFLHVAVFGIIGYVVIGSTWLIGKKTSGQIQFFSKLAMFLAALFGLLFFVYLTFLEPFVIGATCAWCIASSLIMATINLFTLPIVLQAWEDLALEDDDEDNLEEEE